MGDSIYDFDPPQQPYQNVANSVPVNPVIYDRMKHRLMGEPASRNRFTTKFSVYWLTVLLILGFAVNYIVLWTRLPLIYSLLLIGTVPLTGAYIWSVHSMYNNSTTKKMGLVIGIFTLLYSIIMAVVSSKIPKQTCTITT
jgi:hypothetical protein